MDTVKLDRMVITDEVFRIVQDGGFISINPEEFREDENQPEPAHAALFDAEGAFVDWLF